MNRCLLRLGPSFNMGCHILKYHNGIVHHITDSNGETRERNNIQRTTVYNTQIDE